MRVYFDHTSDLKRTAMYIEAFKDYKTDTLRNARYVEVETLEELWALLNKVGPSVCINSDSFQGEHHLGVFPDDPPVY